MATAEAIGRVQAALIDPLTEIGLRRAQGVTVEQHAAFIARLAMRLAYLDEEPLGVLREVVVRNAQGPRRDVWPSEASILSWAHALQPPPAGDSRLVVSYMRSAAGRRAWEEAPELALALQRHLRQAGRPPLEHDWRLLREQARDWSRRRGLLAERRERRGPVPEDEQWLAALADELEAVRARIWPVEGAE